MKRIKSFLTGLAAAIIFNYIYFKFDLENNISSEMFLVILLIFLLMGSISTFNYLNRKE